MPFPMKIQPIDSHSLEEPTRLEPVKPSVVKSRLKRLFERQFLRNSSAAEKVEEQPVHFNKTVSNGGGIVSATSEFEPTSVCLAKMVQNFIEENNEKPSGGAIKCSRNCFNGSCNDSSEDEFDSCFNDSSCASSAEACEILKSLVPCASVNERNLLADTAKIVEKSKICKCKDEVCRKIVTDGLLAVGYDASICKSRWEKSSSYPAGEYEYIDVLIGGERLIVDIDFRSEFEIARSTKTYKSILQTLPFIFVGKADRLQRIIAMVSEAAKQSLKKKGMHIPPWRKAEYIKAKWLSPHARAESACGESNDESNAKTEKKKKKKSGQSSDRSDCEFEEGNSAAEDTEWGEGESVFVLSESSGDEEEKKKKGVTATVVKKDWKPPENIVKPKSLQIGARVVTGLSSVIEDHQP